MVVNKNKRQHEDDSSSGESEDDSKNSRKRLKPLITVSALSNENKNKQLTDVLTELSVFEKNKGLVHKFTAYKKAVLSIKSYPYEIKSGLEAQKLDGVGKKIAKKIDEILKTGGLKKLKCQNQDETLTAINELSRVSGIGPQKAKSLVEEGIKSIKDLNKIKNTLNHHQQIGLKYFNDFEQRVPRKEIEVFEKIVCDTLFKIDPDITSQVCGSYRRGLETSGDIDILISHPNFTLQMKDKKKTFSIIEKLVDSLKKKNILIDDLSLGPLKYMGVCKLPDNVKINNSDTNSSSNSNKKSSKQEEESECDTTIDESTSEDSSDNEDDDSSATEPEDNSKIVKKKAEKKSKPTKSTSTSTSVPKVNKLSTTTTTTTTTNSTKSTSTSTSTNETHIARRIDFKLIPYESYYFGLLHNTGSDEFNRQMRGIALKQGYTLSEYSINKMSHGVKSDKPILVDSEKEIFDIIGMQYYNPNQRNL